MLQELTYLVKLQEIDLKIKELENAKEQYPAAAADLSKQIEQAGIAAAAVTAKLAKFESEISDMDAQAAKVRENLHRSRERLNGITNNREYDAVHAEINTQEAMLAASDGKRKNLEAAVEQYKGAIEEAKAEAEKIKAELEPQIADLNAKIGAIDSNIAEFVKERDNLTPHISKPTLRAYDAIRKKRKSGKAVSVVGNAKTCANCFMVLRPQLYTEIRRGSGYIMCESCGSMMVWDESCSAG